MMTRRAALSPSSPNAPPAKAKPQPTCASTTPARPRPPTPKNSRGSSAPEGVRRNPQYRIVKLELWIRKGLGDGRLLVPNFSPVIPAQAGIHRNGATHLQDLPDQS